MKIESIDNGHSFDFGKTAAEYAKYRDIYPAGLYKRLSEHNVGVSGTTLLDLATGTGVLPKNLAKYGGEIVGADISEKQIAFAKQEAILLGLKNVRYIVSPAEKTGLPDCSFDAITAAQCFWYFDRENTIAEIKRLIKPGGIFIKIYLTHTLNDEIATKSYALVQKMNPNWTPEASGSSDVYLHPFKNGKLEITDCEIPFTRETWHGRMCACRGTLASMDEKTYKKWETEHKKMLSEYPENFKIKHELYIAYYTVK